MTNTVGSNPRAKARTKWSALAAGLLSLAVSAPGAIAQNRPGENLQPLVVGYGIQIDSDAWAETEPTVVITGTRGKSNRVPLVHRHPQSRAVGSWAPGENYFFLPGEAVGGNLGRPTKLDIEFGGDGSYRFRVLAIDYIGAPGYNMSYIADVINLDTSLNTRSDILNNPMPTLTLANALIENIPNPNVIPIAMWSQDHQMLDGIEHFKTATFTFPLPPVAAGEYAQGTGYWVSVCTGGQVCDESITETVNLGGSNSTAETIETANSLSKSLELGVKVGGDTFGGSAEAKTKIEGTTSEAVTSAQTATSNWSNSTARVKHVLVDFKEYNVYKVWRWTVKVPASNGSEAVIETTTYTCTPNAEYPTYGPGEFQSPDKKGFGFAGSCVVKR